MDSNSKTNMSSHITHEFPPFFKVYKDGHIERYMVLDSIPTGLDQDTEVLSKDVVISSATGFKARIFAPKIDSPDQKLPLLVHYHGGGFCIGSPFDVVTKNCLTALVAQANIIAISVDYRLAPEHPLPTAYDDAWASLQWIASHSKGFGQEPLLNQHVDFERIFLMGESAGANITHYVAIKAGISELEGVNAKGALIVHPYFVGEEEDKMIKFLYPASSGKDDDPKLNPGVDPNLSKMGCQKVLVCVAEKDWLRNRGDKYFKILASSEWNGKLEFYESKGQDHCFHMFSNENIEADKLIKKFIDFITED